MGQGSGRNLKTEKQPGKSIDDKQEKMAKLCTTEAILYTWTP